MIEVEMPNGHVLRFEDNTDSAQIEKAAGQWWAANGNKPAREYGWADALTDGYHNIPQSALNAGKDLVNAAMHPIDTAAALGKTGVGFAQKLVPGRQDWEDNADAMIDYVMQRYGGEEALKKSVAADPVGVLSDFAALFSGSGAGLRAGSKIASLAGKGAAADKIGKAASALSKAGTMADPAYMFSRAAGKAADLGYGRTMSAAQKLYESTLKPSTTQNSAAATRALVQAGIENRIPITEGGINKASRLINGLNEQLDNKITEADAAGRTFDPRSVMWKTRFSPTREDIAKSVTPGRDLVAYDKAIEDYIKYHEGDSTIRQAQESKKATYRQLDKRKAFNNNTGVVPGAVDAQYEMANQLRQIVENAVPEAKAINAKEGPLLGLKKQLDRGVVRTGNHNPFGLVPVIAGAAMGGATGNAGSGVATAALASLLGAPGVKSRGAFLLDDLSKKGNPFAAPASALYAGEQMYNADKDAQKKRGILDLFLQEKQ